MFGPKVHNNSAVNPDIVPYSDFAQIKQKTPPSNETGRHAHRAAVKSQNDRLPFVSTNSCAAMNSRRVPGVAVPLYRLG